MGEKKKINDNTFTYIENNNERDKTNASFNGLKRTIMKRNEMKETEQRKKYGRARYT